MAKRKTKQQRIDEEKAALRQRVLDIAAGANLDITDEGTADEFFCLSAAELERFMRGLEAQFVQDNNDYDFIVGYWCLENYASPTGLVEFMHGCGIRADGSHLEDDNG